MLAEGLDAASEAFEVGYESASQFNREYKRFFGQPPMRDIKARKEDPLEDVTSLSYNTGPASTLACSFSDDFQSQRKTPPITTTMSK